ncbi:di-heme-cytochrome C peroxidase [Marinobacterium zhoushanense]|nr:di-heme-cytochrome C peroxidase [Marinobacterium zhoushanense]
MSLLLTGCGDEPPATNSSSTSTGLQLLNQNWNDQQRETAWYTSFGSRIMPLSWFLVLEDADGQALFSRPDNLRRFGFALAGSSPANPYNLPIGLASTPPHQGERWVGLGCAACHSGQIYYRGKSLHIDGGQSLVDFQLLEREVIAALDATLRDYGKFTRFAQALGAGPDIRQSLQTRTERLKKMAALNDTHYAYGRGRLDAFGQIFNAVAADFLELPENRREPDAPVSYPVLWDAAHLDLVQWNGSAPNAGPGPLVQNATTALAVFGDLNIHSDGIGYDSGVELENLGTIQDLWYHLKAPAWPEQQLGVIDRALAEQGSAIYQTQCLSCHMISDQSKAKRELKATLVSVDKVGTDRTMADNFVNAKAKSGAFEGKKLLYVAGNRLGEEAYSIELVLHATLGALLQQPWQSIKAGLHSFHKVYSAPLDERPYAYKARPLSGIWASAPYLHNGSVPSLAALLSTERPSRFAVGRVEYDPRAVGLGKQVLDAAQVSQFDTTEPGNGNAGHLYGTGLSDTDKRALIEYLKTL